MYFKVRTYESQTLDDLRERLTEKGSCHGNFSHQFLTVDQWKTLNYEAGQLTFEHNHSFKSSKIKSADSSTIQSKPIFDVVTSVQSRKFITALTGLKHFNIEVCECHVCEVGDFIPQEWFEAVIKNSDYLVYFFLDEYYEGGELLITRDNHEELAYTPQSGDILISTCSSSHQVKSIMEGKRVHIVSMIQNLE